MHTNYIITPNETTIMEEIFETNSSFQVNYSTAGEVQFLLF